MERKTLEQILNEEKQHRHEEGIFGIKECKKHILKMVEFFKISLYQLLEEYVENANTDIFFNKQMILACWELINE